MSWEIQFRKTEAQLDIKLASFLNPQSFANVDHIENDINRLLDELTIIIDQAEQTISSSPSCKSSLISKSWILSKINLQLRCSTKYLAIETCYLTTILNSKEQKKNPGRRRIALIFWDQ